MITIRRTSTNITIKGHSTDANTPRTYESSQACAAVTALANALIFGIQDELAENAPYFVEKGDFSMDTTQLTEKGLLLVNVFTRTARELAKAYAEYITVEG